MTLPNFLVIGAMKAGTSALWEYLRAHPQIYMPPVKELNFFSGQWERGRDWYESFFNDAGGALAVGEASPSYGMVHSHPVPQRIASLIPDAKLIYLLRHPVERMRSAYIHWVTGGKETRPPEQAFSEDLNYLFMSMYAYQLEGYLEYFPRERILLVLAERMRDERVPTLKRILEFLNVESSRLPGNALAEFHRTSDKRQRTRLAQRVSRLPGRAVVARVTPQPVLRLYGKLTTRTPDPKRPMFSDELEKRIVDALRSDVAKLRQYLGSDFDGWGLA